MLLESRDLSLEVRGVEKSRTEKRKFRKSDLIQINNHRVYSHFPYLPANFHAKYYNRTCPFNDTLKFLTPKPESITIHDPQMTADIPVDEAKAQLLAIQKSTLQNQKCIDCNAPSPTWASPMYGSTPPRYVSFTLVISLMKQSLCSTVASSYSCSCSRVCVRGM